MFLQLAHTQLDVYKVVQDLISECYRLTTSLPNEERFNLSQQIRRAAVSVQLNLAEGASRKSTAERKRFYEIARGSVIEVDAALDICVRLNLVEEKTLKKASELLNRTYAMLAKMVG